MLNHSFGPSRRLRLLVLLLSMSALAAGLWYWKTQYVHSAITRYQEADRPALARMLYDDWYWLVAENATDFSMDYMFDHQAATYHYPDKSLSIVVYREAGGVPAGFVTYHRIDGAHGRVQFLAIDEKSRRKGYGRTLLEYAINELRKQGVCFVELAVRQSNVRARALYQSLGFMETWRTPDGFAGYSKMLCDPTV